MRILFLGLCLGLAGCVRVPSAPPETTPPPVTVSRPVERDVTDYADFTGRTAAVDSVEVRAHVWGYLEKVNFKEGALVKKGDILFELDPRPYQAALNQAKAKVVQDEAQLKYDEAEYQRALKLVASGAVTKSELDKTAAARDVDGQALSGQESSLPLAGDHLDTVVRWPKEQLAGLAGQQISLQIKLRRAQLYSYWFE